MLQGRLRYIRRLMKWEIKETTQVITEMNNGIIPYTSGTVTKNKTVEVERAKEKV